MAYRIFTIPLASPDQGLADLNQFLATHQVVEVDRQFHASGTQASWCFCVSYATAGKGDAAPRTMFGKIDYKKELSDEDFAVFCQLRDVRKLIADEMSMPVFARSWHFRRRVLNRIAGEV